MDLLHVKSLTFRRRKWFVLIMGLMMMKMMMIKGVAPEDQIGVPAAAGLLCISECATCPVICSPPPPSPKESYNSPIAPPTTHHSPPLSYSHSPPPAPPRTSEPPSSWGSPPPPPPFKYNNNVPPGQGPPTTGQHDYPYPYYYFYASHASFISFHSNALLVMLFYFVGLFFF